MPDNLESILRQQGVLSSPNQAPQELGVTDYLADAALGVPRGLLGAVDGAYSLVDTLAFDVLPDLQIGEVLGESKTVVGGAVEGVTQFLSGFIPITGQLSRIGSFSKLGSITQGALSGAVTDFTVFRGGEERLSNLIQTIPALENPITDFLAADDDDGEVTGRLKNVLEGLGVGALTDVTIQALRGFKKTGKAAEELAEPLREGIAKNTPEEVVEPLGVISKQNTLENVIDRPVDIDELSRRVAARQRQAAEGIDVTGSPHKKSAGELLEAELTEEYLNLSKFEDQDLAVTLRGSEDIFVDYFQKNLPNTKRRSLDEIETAAFEELAAQTNVPQRESGAFFNNLTAKVGEDSLTAQVGEDLDRLPRILARVHATRLRVNVSTNRLRDAAAKAVSGTDADRALLVDYLDQHVKLIGHLKGYAAEFGRGLRLFGGQVKNLNENELASILDGYGGAAKINDLADKVLTAIDENGAEGLAKLAERPMNRGIHIMNEVFINSVLSGPRTLSTNFLSNVAISVYRPFERLLGSGLNLALGKAGAGAEIQRNLSSLMGLTKGFSESFRLARVAFKENRSIIDSLSSKIEVPSAFSSKDNGVIGNMINWVGHNVVRAPSRVLQGTDEFFKQINFRASLWADLSIEGQSKGLRGDDLAAYIHDQMDVFIKDGARRSQLEAGNLAVQQARDAGIVDDDQLRRIFATAGERSEIALETAREATFTQDLPKGSVSRSLQNLVNKHPIMRQFAPFIRTPTNLIGFGTSRSPLGAAVDAMGYLRKFVFGTEGLKNSRLQMLQQLASSNAREQAEATGRFAMAVGFSAYITNLVAGGKITGRGPSDPAQRRTMEQAGWQPYSIRFGDRWYSFQRSDPLASVLGLGADLFEGLQAANDDEAEQLNEVAGAFITAITSNITQKSYLTGIQNLVNAMEDPERFGPSFMRRHIAAYVPNVLNQGVNERLDPTMREARGMLDGALSRIPGLSENLDPRRDLLGQPIGKKKQLFGDYAGGVSNWFLPVAVSDIKDDVISTELRELGHAFNAPKTTQGGVDLLSVRMSSGRTAYDRMSELAGKVRIEGKTLRQELRRVIGSAEYRNAAPSSIEGIDDPKVDLLQKVVRRYRREALEQVKRESSTLRNEFLTVQRQRLLDRRGNPGGLFAQ